jgi:hypothetical protein
MSELTCEEWTAVTPLPAEGTPQRLEWDEFIRFVNELYPDWASIQLGGDHLSRQEYERHYRQYYVANP